MKGREEDDQVCEQCRYTKVAATNPYVDKREFVSL